MDLFSKKLDLMASLALWAMSFIVVIVAFVPLSPGMPSAGLDQSWVFAMNQAMSQGFSFGEDIIFTFGPYASIMDKGYHPATDFMMVSGSLYLALSYWACFVVLMKDVQKFWSFSFCVLLGGLCLQQDVLFYSFPLLVGLAGVKIILALENKVLQGPNLVPLYVALLFAPLGFLPLIKGNLLALASVIIILFATFIARRHRLLAVICICSPVVTMFILWIVLGQSATALLPYLINLGPLISGYTDAMSVDGNITEVVVYLIASTLLLLTILAQKQQTKATKSFLFVVYLSYLFFAFKAGFVRHDGHAVIAGLSIMVAALLLTFYIKSKIVPPVVLVLMILGYYITSHHMNLSGVGIANNFKSTYSSAWLGIENRVKNPHKLREDFDAAVSSLRLQASFPVLQGTTDIYSYNQSHLIASGNTWSPRPVFQSFAAYTPLLAEVNRGHLLGEQAPDNIFFKVESIGRFPAIDDGVSWPVLMLKYQPTRMHKDYLILRKREGVSTVVEPLKLIKEKHKFGESVSLPYSIQPIFVQMDIEPNILGRLARILFKSSYLTIWVENKNGMKSQYRVISGMAKSGFMISPLVENSTEFSMLYGKIAHLDDKKIKSMTITSSGDKNWLWKDEYWVTFSQIETAAPVDISSITTFDGVEDKFSNLKVATAVQCDGAIDAINGASFVPREYSASSLLSINGWLATSVEKGTLPDAVYVTLTNEQGKYIFIRTRHIPRPDVADFFKKTTLNESGFGAIADIAAMGRGQYTLGIAVEESGRVEVCPKINVPIKITK